MRHALADLERGGYGGCNPFKIEKFKKNVIKQNKKNPRRNEKRKGKIEKVLND